MIPTINIMATGSNLKNRRLALGLSVYQLWMRMEVVENRSSIYRWESGTALPSIDNLVVLANVLQCKVDDLLVVEWC